MEAMSLQVLKDLKVAFGWELPEAAALGHNHPTCWMIYEEEHLRLDIHQQGLGHKSPTPRKRALHKDWKRCSFHYPTNSQRGHR